VVLVQGTHWHKAFELYAHITWSTRFRVRIVTKHHAHVIAEAVLRSAERHKMRVLAQAALADHVHVLVSFRPDSAISSFVRDAKSESSRRTETVTWSRGFYAGSICRGHIDAVRRYLGRQYSHHPDLIPPD